MPKITLCQYHLLKPHDGLRPSRPLTNTVLNASQPTLAPQAHPSTPGVAACLTTQADDLNQIDAFVNRSGCDGAETWQAENVSGAGMLEHVQ